MGTGRSSRGFWLSRLAAGITLFTFDGDPSCASAVGVLNGSQACVRSIFTPGDSTQTLSCFRDGDIDLAWINGSDATAASDISHAMRLRAKTVLFDGAKARPQVAAVCQALGGIAPGILGQ